MIIKQPVLLLLLSPTAYAQNYLRGYDTLSLAESTNCNTDFSKKENCVSESNGQCEWCEAGAVINLEYKCFSHDDAEQLVAMGRGITCSSSSTSNIVFEEAEDKEGESNTWTCGFKTTEESCASNSECTWCPKGSDAPDILADSCLPTMSLPGLPQWYKNWYPTCNDSSDVGTLEDEEVEGNTWTCGFKTTEESCASNSECTWCPKGDNAPGIMKDSCLPTMSLPGLPQWYKNWYPSCDDSVDVEEVGGGDKNIWKCAFKSSQEKCDSSTDCSWCAANEGSPFIFVDGCFSTDYLTDGMPEWSQKQYTCDSSGDASSDGDAKDISVPVEGGDFDGLECLMMQDENSCVANADCSWCPKVTDGPAFLVDMCAPKTWPDVPENPYVTEMMQLVKKYYPTCPVPSEADTNLLMAFAGHEDILECLVFQNAADCAASEKCAFCTSGPDVPAFARDFCGPQEWPELPEALTEKIKEWYPEFPSCGSTTASPSESEPAEMTSHEFNFVSGVTHTLKDGEVDKNFCDPSSPMSYSGYMSVQGSKFDEKGEDKNYFFWMVESRQATTKTIADKNTPFVVWLTGGPGCSSSLALLKENGPCFVNEDGTGTVVNEFGWNNDAHVLWLDQPTGVGFSYGKETDKNEEMVGENAYYFLQAFMKAHPEYKENPLFVTGESYGGHYVPAIGHRIYSGNQENKEGTIPLNLKGIGIGNGLTDPEIQYQYYGEMAYNNDHGIHTVSEDTYKKMTESAPKCAKLIKECNTKHRIHAVEAFECQAAVEVCNMSQMMPYRLEGLNPYDIRAKCGDSPLCYNFNNVENFMRLQSTRDALHVSDKSAKWESCNLNVHSHFTQDWMKDMSPLVADLLHGGIPVLIYAGDVDYICNYLGNEAWTKSLDWQHKDEFNAAPVHDWNSGTGKARTANGFTFLQVKDAGHMVPMDQPKVALQLINDFVSGREF